jgi:hypothetical protein
MEAKYSSETSVDFQRIIRRYVPGVKTFQRRAYKHIRFIERLMVIQLNTYLRHAARF